MDRYRCESRYDAERDGFFMNAALKMAELAESRGELPVGAAVVREGEIISSAHNTTESGCCVLRHAELEAMRAACAALNSRTLEGCTLYVTLEPCPMCAGAIFLARPDRVVYGASDSEYGALGGKFDLFELYALNSRRPAVAGGVLAERCSELLKGFFAKKR